MKEGTLFLVLGVFIITSYFIKFILKEYGQDISLFNDHHKDPIAFLRLLRTGISWKRRIIYISILCVYIVSFIAFLVGILNRISSQ